MNKEELIINIWERTFNQHSLESALSILSSVYNSEKKEFAQISLGQRNFLLIKCYELLFGNKLNCVINCEECSCKMEFTLSTDDIKFRADKEQMIFEFKSDGYIIKYRLTDSYDMAAAAKKTDLMSASKLLMERCIADLTYKGEKISSEDLPENIIQEFSAEAAGNDPCFQLQINLVCANCGFEWASFFDTSSFLLKSINAFAKIILSEVNIIASAYGWSESEILRMTRHKRNWYLNAISPQL